MRLTGISAWIFMMLWLLNVWPAQAYALPVQQELVSARLSGQGSYRWFGMKIYDAFLWQENGADNKLDLFDSKYVLELVYAREISGKRIADVSLDEMRKLNKGTTTQQSAWLHLMQEIFPDVHEGTRLTGVYLPGRGVRFYHDGRLLKEVPDAEFARAFFAIWLDENTSAKRLRSQLLGLSS